LNAFNDYLILQFINKVLIIWIIIAQTLKLINQN